MVEKQTQENEAEGGGGVKPPRQESARVLQEQGGPPVGKQSEQT